jgi:hypothetical protein
MKEKLKKSLNNETRKTTLVFIIQHCKNDLPKNLLYITTANYQHLPILLLKHNGS